MSPSSASTRVCPLLERESETKILSFAPVPWVLRQCIETDFVYLENPPAYESFKEDFAWEHTYEQEGKRRQKAEPIRFAISSGVKKFRKHVLKRNKIRAMCNALLRGIQSPQIHLLDVGCGWGNLLEEVLSALPADLRNRCVPHGIELSKTLSGYAQERFGPFGGSCIHDNALNGFAQFPADYFDVIIMSSFLEHEINPLPLLRRCRERLRASGYIIIKVPNLDCLNRRVRGTRWCGWRWPDHVNYFTPKTLNAMVARADLRIVRMTLLDRQPLSDNMYAVVQKPLS